jgi:hypothetical protein
MGKNSVIFRVVKWYFTEHSFSYCLRGYLFLFMFMFIFVHELTTILAVSIGSEYAIFHTGSELK